MAKNEATKVIDLFNDFAVNEELSQDGVWVKYAGDAEFLIARAGNKQYRKVAQTLYQKNARILEGKNEAAADKLTEIVITAMTKGILLGWRGNVRYKGEPLPYSKENATTLLTHERFREWVDSQAKDEAAYAAIQEEEDEANLS